MVSKRILLGCIAVLLSSPLLAMERIAILSTSFVMENKFRLMAEAAGEQGVELAWSQVDRHGQEGAAEALAGAGLIIIDAPRSDDQAQIQQLAGELLQGERRPIIHINRMTPARRLWAENLPLSQANRVMDYYLAGTSVNHRHLFHYLRTLLDGGDITQIPPPQPLPEGGIYHPGHAEMVFADSAAYLSWWQQSHQQGWQGRPVIAVETSPSYISDGQTRWMDEVITAIEDAKALPLVFYRTPGIVEGRRSGTATEGFPNPVEGKPSTRHDPILLHNGELLPQVILVNNFLGGNPDGRKAWYQHMGLPVLNIINYRGGNLADYLADNAGVDSFSIPFSLTTAEYIGMVDPVVLNTNEDGEMRPIPGHTPMLVNKALQLAELQQTERADKRLALFFWNHPPGEHNMGASNLNVPRSLEALTTRLATEGYTVAPLGEQSLIDTIPQLLRPSWRGEGLEELMATEHWDFLPLEDYKRWFRSLPYPVQDEIDGFFGHHALSYWVREHQGQWGFVIPRIELGNMVILPQPARGEPGQDHSELYHDTKVPLNHAYLATYLWARETLGVDAIIHFGTHGSQEWAPGKERGLWRYDYPNLLVGDVPVLYPYIVDNIGEAIHVKRRGRGVIISHQTPPFSPAGLSDDFVAINDLIREYQMLDDGLVKANNRSLIIEQAVRMNIHQDMAWSVADLEREFEGFLRDIEDYLEDLGSAMQPLGLHSFGETALEEHLALNIMLILGDPLMQALGIANSRELFRADYREIRDSTPYRFVLEHMVQALPLAKPDDALQALVTQGQELLARLKAETEMTSLLHGLNGLWIDPSYGGDPIRNPDALPTGRNMYGFDPSRVPTRAAWEAGREAMAGLILSHQASHGEFPAKLAFSMWSTETMRHLGMLEAQILYAMGVRPVWDRGGRVVDLALIPLEELGRPRIDPVISLTGLYRDQFPNVMERFNQAIEMVAEADEAPAQNPLRANTLRIEQALLAQGIAAEQAREYALTRLFGNESGDYGTGLPDATLMSDQWEAEDGQLAEIYLERMSWGYGPNSANWSNKIEQPDGEPLNLYAEQLRGTQAAVFSRSSNLRGLLDTDHPFEYLGGISLALQHLEGEAPQLYISNMRDPQRARLQTAERFLATELRAVYQHPNWIQEMQAEGYAGTLQLLNTINNFWGWQVMDRNVVRDDQWEEFHQTYVMDRYELEIEAWFEQSNPAAMAQIIERMLEAVRKDYWEASEQTVRELVERYQDIASRHDIHTPNQTFQAYVAEMASGFGLDGPSPDAEAGQQPPTVQGQELREVEPPTAGDSPIHWWALLLLLWVVLGFAHRAWLARRHG